MYCRYCHRAIPVGADFCPECGTRQTDGAQASGTYQPPGPAPAAVPTVRTAAPRWEDTGDVSTGRWFLTLLVEKIPLVGIVMLFVWAFGGERAVSRRNWARAKLIWVGIGVAVSVLLWSAAAALIAAIAPTLNGALQDAAGSIPRWETQLPEGWESQLPEDWASQLPEGFEIQPPSF